MNAEHEPSSADRQSIDLLAEARAVLDEAHEADRSSWRAVDLASHLVDPDNETGPEILARSDGLGLFYGGRRNELHGPYESGKSWIAGLATLEVIRGDEVAVWIDFEDSPSSVVRRMLALGATQHELLERFRYVAPVEPLNPATELDIRVELHGSGLVVIDAANEAMAMAGLDPNVNRDVAAWYSTLPRLAVDAGAASLVLDHVAKDPASRRGAVGAGHKLGAVSGASYLVEIGIPFGRGSTGFVRLRLEKDRPGFVRGRHPGNRPVVAEIHFDATDPAALAVDVRAPTGADAETWRPTHLMDSVSRFLEDATEPLSTNVIVQGVRGKSDYLKAALAHLVRDGFAIQSSGPRGAVLYASKRPFREEEG